jgi:hypothetical protein
VIYGALIGLTGMHRAPVSLFVPWSDKQTFSKLLQQCEAYVKALGVMTRRNTTGRNDSGDKPTLGQLELDITHFLSPIAISQPAHTKI